MARCRLPFLRTERAAAVAAYAKAIDSHRPRREAGRALVVLTAAVLREELAQRRRATRRAPEQAHALDLFAEV